MEIGVIFPQSEAGGDRGAVRAIGQAVADLGYTHLAAYDHVLGGDTAVLGDLGGPYTIDTTFREPLLMFSYVAGFTDLAFATSILIGPQRQTALLAKQAAELDLLCNGRFRLGLGIGWNKLEYDALGVPFEERAAILEEQVAVLRALWTEWSVTFDGRYHHIRASGIAPPPVQRPIPIWIGGHAPAALRRVGRIADGWFPMARPGGGLEAALETDPRGRGRGRARRVEPAVRRQAGVLRARPRQNRRARPPLGGGRGEPPVVEHHARRPPHHGRTYRGAGGDGRGPPVGTRRSAPPGAGAGVTSGFGRMEG